MNQSEARFQDYLIKRLRRMFPGCIILKNDPNYLQGIPDLLLLWRDRWASFECKSSDQAPHQPNQQYYVLMMDAMSFSSFVFPENVEEVLGEVQLAFQAGRTTRVSQRQQVSLGKLRRFEASGSLDELPGRKARSRTTRSRTPSHQTRRKVS